MKKLLISTAAMMLTVASFACTNLIVGKKASVDGSVMCTYNCDGFGFSGALSYSLPGMHPDGEMISVGRGNDLCRAFRP